MNLPIGVSAALVGLILMTAGQGRTLADELPPVQSLIELPAQSLARQQSAEVSLPALPPKPGQVTVLHFRVFVETAGPGGCNLNATVKLNGTPIGRYQSDGSERLIGRQPTLTLVPQGLELPVFSGDKLMVMFAPSADVADSMTADGLGATFALDITDLARGVDGNALTFTNNFPANGGENAGDLKVTDLRVGWLDRDKLPKAPRMAPERGPMAQEVTTGELTLAQGNRGGFSIRMPDGAELLVETALGMKPTAPALLIAEDGEPVAGVTVSYDRVRAPGFRLEASRAISDWSALCRSRSDCCIGASAGPTPVTSRAGCPSVTASSYGRAARDSRWEAPRTVRPRPPRHATRQCTSMRWRVPARDSA